MASRDDESFCDIPIVGRVAAGEPILAVENIDDTFRVDRSLLGNHQDVFGLRVVGELKGKDDG